MFQSQAQDRGWTNPRGCCPTPSLHAPRRSFVLDLLFPLECQFCGRDRVDRAICSTCAEEFQESPRRFCPRCAAPAFGEFLPEDGCPECRGRALGFDQAVTMGRYQGPLRECCLAMKHRSGVWMARTFGQLIVEAHREALKTAAIDLVVAVPLHWSRRWGRGFNQTEELASSIARQIDRPLIGALSRVRRTPKLSGLSTTERKRLLQGVFRARSAKLTSWPRATVLLVDDVLTTGATCGAAARALKAAGAQRVMVAVVARAGRLGT